MNALLVYPPCPETFWSFRHSLPFARLKAASPPLGLLTVAAMLPPDWAKKVVDMNVAPLDDQDLLWADLVFISAMVLQKDATQEVLQRCRRLNRRVVGGGPLFTRLHQELKGVDHVIAGEAEEVLPRFLADLEAGSPQPLYQAQGYPDLGLTPIPSWELIDLSNYRTLLVQFSRGCPFDCDFCDVVALFGRRPRFKAPGQVLAELERLYQLGWRGTVMMVDDNFIGQRARARELLGLMAGWQEQRRRPFNFLTQASVNLADDPQMLALMAQANFTAVFLGLETPSASSLQECHKHQNQGRDLLADVRTIQGYGLEVMGGFIVGFDADPPSIFKDQVRFIKEAAIPTAMVGLLSLAPGTRLWERMRNQDRLLGLTSGNNAMDAGALNFVPKMGAAKLLEGYRYVLDRLYEPRAYYRRVLKFLRRRGTALKRRQRPHHALRLGELAAALRILWRLGFRERGRLSFWALLVRAGLRGPARLAEAMGLAATGYHLCMVTKSFLDDGRAASRPENGALR